ncbi:MAG TPA: outer membrane protein transport protein [Gemmatimonadaceae bacterium]|nr:outer membrane protein transport protein [Gemmatimonadaceae bacterium]
MTLHRASRFALSLSLLGLPAAAGAQAFGLNEIGSCALARAFATTGSPCEDGSSIYWNPGAMPRARGLTALAGAAVIKIDGDFTRDTTFQRYNADVPTAVVPHLFLNYRTGSRIALGLGVYVPYGLTSQWGEDFPGRFSAKKASLQTIYVQPNIAFQISDGWSIGAGPVIGHSTVELIQGADLSALPTSTTTPNAPTFGQLGIAKRTEFARAQLKGSAMAYGVNVGLHGRITPNWEMGARFLSSLYFKYDDADATFEQRSTGLTLAANNPLGAPAGTPVDALLAPQFAGSGALTAQKVKTRIMHPAQAQVGVGYTGFPNTTVSVDYAWVGWKAFKTLPVEFQGPAKASSRELLENYNNTSSIRLGLEHRYTSGYALRAGFAAAASAAPDVTVTPLLPEQDRAYGTLGGTLPINHMFSLDAAYAHIFTPGRRGRIDERQTPTQTADQLNSGAYTLRANILSLSLKASL